MKIIYIAFLVFSWIFLLSSPFGSLAFAQEKPNVLFIHHSVGHGLIRDGSVREILAEASIDLWDHGYNDSILGLRNPEGDPAGCYWIPDNNTNPVGLAKLFALNPDEDNTFGKMLKNHDVIIFKSCFPVSKIKKDNILKDLTKPERRSLYNYKRHYLNIRKAVDKHLKKVFIILTQPPLHPNATNEEETKRARSFVEWLKSEDYLGGRKNLFIFDYFSLLADPKTNTLKNEYQIDPNEKNSHPNPIANMLIGPQFSDFIINTIIKSKRKKVNISNLPKITFNNPEWPYSLIRISNPLLGLSGKIISDTAIRRIYWSDLKGHGGDLVPGKSWTINNLTIDHGITKIVVTAIKEDDLRSSSVIGLQYYSGRKHQAIIADESLKNGTLTGLSWSEKNPYVGNKHLVFGGTGQLERVAINGINLIISDCDPITTHLEIYYDQGSQKTKPRLFILGIGQLTIDVDDKPGYEKIVVPFKRFKYVHDKLDSLVIRGDWGKGSKVYFDSVSLVCNKKGQ